MERRTLIIIGLTLGIIALIVVIILIVNWSRGQDELTLPEYLNPSVCPKDFSPLPLILVSLDGFHPKYLKRGVTPTLKKLIEKGVSTPFMTSSFPSLTFPNHYSIVTGLYPEVHGIIANSFSDPEFDAKFSYKTQESRKGRWWGGEPIWNTLRKNGLLAATYFWPGSEAPIQGHQPSYWYEYASKTPLSQRVEQVMQWVKYPASKRPAFISLYSHQPDSAGHGYGPDSEQVTSELKKVDSMVKQLLKSLLQQNLISCVNILIVSDHGMASSGAQKAIDLKDFLPKELAPRVNLSPGAFGRISLEVDQAKRSNASKMLEEALACKAEEFHLFRREELPKRLHYSNNSRIGDYVLLLKEGYAVNLNSNFYLKGFHGYDSHVDSMNGLFIAYGPAFKENYEVKPFQNIELYNLMCHLLGVNPAPNNGTDGLLNVILRTSYSNLSNLTNSTVVPFNPPLLLQLQDEYDLRALQRESHCHVNRSIIESSIKLIRESEEGKVELFSEVSPWGPPLYRNSSGVVMLLLQPDYISGYFSELKISLWTSFAVKKLPSVDSSAFTYKVNWMPDARMPLADTHCSAKDSHPKLKEYTLYPQFPPEFAQNEKTKELASLISNSVPFHSHLALHWKELMTSLIPKWFQDSQSNLNVIVGPIFDSDVDGVADDIHLEEEEAGVPTDYFLIVSKCSSEVKSLSDCPEDQFHSLSYIYPQKLSVDICVENATEYALLFSAKIQDIERITGLQFFPRMSQRRRLEVVTNEYYHLW